jgi:hypothetical protein
MNQTLEQPVAVTSKEAAAGCDQPKVEWRWANEPQWSRSDEAFGGSDLWDALATPTAQRRGVARDFASALQELEGVGGIWVTDLKNDLDIAISLEDPDLESQVRNVFIDLVCARLDPSEGELFVFPSDEVPGWATSGDSLL